MSLDFWWIHLWTWIRNNGEKHCFLFPGQVKVKAPEFILSDAKPVPWGVPLLVTFNFAPICIYPIRWSNGERVIHEGHHPHPRMQQKFVADGLMTLIIVTLSDGSNQQKYLSNQLTSPQNAPCPHLLGFRTSSCPHMKDVHTEKPESQSLTLTDRGRQSS